MVSRSSPTLYGERYCNHRQAFWPLFAKQDFSDFRARKGASLKGGRPGGQAGCTGGDLTFSDHAKLLFVLYHEEENSRSTMEIDRR